MKLQDELRAAVAAVREASGVCRAVQQRRVTLEGGGTLDKEDRSPVTVADFASQAVVCARLREAFADVPVVAEEASAALREGDAEVLRDAVVEHVRSVRSDADAATVLNWIDYGGASGGSGGRFWTLDPIDGTKGFLRGEQYAVALALIEGGARGEVVLGVLGCPNLGEGAGGMLLTAVRGEGTRELPLDADQLDSTDGRTISVSDVSDPGNARFCESVESGHSDQGQSAAIAARLGITAEPVRMDSQAKYATLARGDASIYLRLPTRADYREKIWDHAAGMLAVTEAGGRVTDVDGKPLDFSHGRQLEGNRGVIATNGKVHDAVLAAVGEVIA